MTKTPVVIALGLLLAATVVAPPPASAGQLPEECENEIQGLLSPQALRTRYPTLIVPLQSCIPEIPDVPTVCRAPQVGVQPTCLTPPSAEVELCKSGIGAKVHAGQYGELGSCQNLPAYGLCGSGYYGAWVGNAQACLAPSTGTCADSLPKVPDCGTGVCTGPTYGVIVNGFQACVDPLAYVPEVPEVPEGPGCVPQLALVTGDGCEAPPPGPEPDCDDTDDEPWFGGTDVECEYDCHAGDVLTIYGETRDRTPGRATISGYTECGGAEADCVAGESGTCGGASPRPTTQDDRDAICRAESDEWVDSEVYVACWTLVNGVLCDVVPELPHCTKSLVWSVQMRSLCLASNPQLSQGVVDSLTAVIPESVTFVAFESQAGQVVAIRYGIIETLSGPMPYCTGQVFPLT